MALDGEETNDGKLRVVKHDPKMTGDEIFEWVDELLQVLDEVHGGLQSDGEKSDADEDIRSDPTKNKGWRNGNAKNSPVRHVEIHSPPQFADKAPQARNPHPTEIPPGNFPFAPPTGYAWPSYPSFVPYPWGVANAHGIEASKAPSAPSPTKAQPCPPPTSPSPSPSKTWKGKGKGSGKGGGTWGGRGNPKGGGSWGAKGGGDAPRSFVDVAKRTAPPTVVGFEPQKVVAPKDGNPNSRPASPNTPTWMDSRGKGGGKGGKPICFTCANKGLDFEHSHFTCPHHAQFEAWKKEQNTKRFGK